MLKDTFKIKDLDDLVTKVGYDPANIKAAEELVMIKNTNQALFFFSKKFISNTSTLYLYSLF